MTTKKPPKMAKGIPGKLRGVTFQPTEKQKITRHIELLKSKNRYLGNLWVRDQRQIKRLLDEIERLKKHLFLRRLKRFLRHDMWFILVFGLLAGCVNTTDIVVIEGVTVVVISETDVE